MIQFVQAINFWYVPCDLAVMVSEVILILSNLQANLCIDKGLPHDDGYREHIFLST